MISDHLETLKVWYTQNTGVARVKQFICSYNDWDSRYEQPRTPWQIDKWELVKLSVLVTGGLGGVFGGRTGLHLAKNKFREMSSMSVYTCKSEMFRTGHSWLFFGTMSYAIPMALRAGMIAGICFGLPMILGIYNGDKDYVSHYIGAGALAGVFMGYRAGWRAQLLMAATLSILVGLPLGGQMWFLQSEYNPSPLILYRWKQRRIEELEPYIVYKKNMREEMNEEHIKEYLSNSVLSDGALSDGLSNPAEHTDSEDKT